MNPRFVRFQRSYTGAEFFVNPEHVARVDHMSGDSTMLWFADGSGHGVQGYLLSVIDKLQGTDE